VRFGETVIHGSGRIIDELEKRFPEPPLYPADPALRVRALELQSRFDESVGPMVRRAFFSAMFAEPGYICRMFASERAPLSRALYRATFPLVGGRMRSAMGITDQASIDEAFAATDEALAFVASQAGPEGYLVGDRFTVADLTAAALLAPVVSPPDSPMERPEPVPEAVARCVARWSDHPGVAWVLDQYRRHRPPRAPSS
jgi:glutathione S-transferase